MIEISPDVGTWYDLLDYSTGIDLDNSKAGSKRKFRWMAIIRC